MILIKTNQLEKSENTTRGEGELQITGSPAMIYNDMVILLMQIKKDKRLQKIFIDASDTVLSEDVTIMEENR